jgi:hypothetical protein
MLRASNAIASTSRIGESRQHDEPPFLKQLRGWLAPWLDVVAHNEPLVARRVPELLGDVNCLVERRTSGSPKVLPIPIANRNRKVFAASSRPVFEENARARVVRDDESVDGGSKNRGCVCQCGNQNIRIAHRYSILTV